jgi:hypothetical protein
MSRAECNAIAVKPLPSGSGGSNTTKQQMNDVNVELAALSADSCASSKFDPPAPSPVVQTKIIQNFQSGSMNIADSIAIIGYLCIVYGLIAK